MICINKPPDVLFVRRLGVIADRLHFQRDSTSGLMEEVGGNGKRHLVRGNNQLMNLNVLPEWKALINDGILCAIDCGFPT
jgi:hypothetical protein